MELPTLDPGPFAGDVAAPFTPDATPDDRPQGPVTWHVPEGNPPLRRLTLEDFAGRAAPEFFMPDNTPLCPSISRKAALAVHFADPETGIYGVPVSPLECMIWLFLCAHHPDALAAPGYDAAQRLVVPLRDRFFDLRRAAESWVDTQDIDGEELVTLALTTWQASHKTRVVPTQKKTASDPATASPIGSASISGSSPEETSADSQI